MANLLGFKKSIPIQHISDPFAPWGSEVSRTMRDFFNFFEPVRLQSQGLEDVTITPSVDVLDEEDQIKIEAEMPGIDEKDISVSVGDGFLTLKGTKATSKGDQGKSYMIREVTYGDYERTISLPSSVDVDKAKASFKKGMLWVNIPKKPECAKKSRTLEVEKVS